MDDAHLVAAVRYVENNPVAAKMVTRAQDWPWSSARSHIAGKRVTRDPLTDVSALGEHVRNWRALLRLGVGNADLEPEGEAMAEAIEARLRTGHPLAAEQWMAEQEKLTGRALRRQRPGPKPKRSKSPDQPGLAIPIG